ncbi:MAG: error-prone DNA polymerase [Solirubrobacterales bacterium]|nr:error-prone DNA polymerase [Solirubrobacterales bacterium]
MSAPYVELHCHSSFSFLDGASSPLELASRAVDLGYSALALTDHDGIWGSMEFAVACRGAGIRPLTGTELTVGLDDSPGPSRADPRGILPLRAFHLTLLVENDLGYRNLCRLLTRSHADTRTGPERRAIPPILPLEVLAGYSEGLICLSGCAGSGLIPAAFDDGDTGRGEALARKLRGWFGPENFRIELQRPWWRYDMARNRWLAGLAGRLGVPTVATGNVHSHDPARSPLQDALVAVRTGTGLAASEPWRRGNSTSVMATPQQMAARFSRYPEAVAETARIAERIEFDPERELGYRYPQSDDPEADRTLAGTCRERLEQRYRGSTLLNEARGRLENELKIIRGLGLSGFFLLHQDLLELAREVASEVRGSSAGRAVLPPGRGRGSSVSSIVCYLTGLSHVDPVAAGLFPGRFLNEEVTVAPDIDLDFPRDIRAALIPRIHERYGHEHSALVAAFPTYRSRGAIRDFGKVLGIPGNEIELASRSVDFHSGAIDLGRDLAAAIGPERSHSRAWRHLVSLVAESRNVPRHPSQHSGGMVISTRPLVEICPVVPTAMAGRQTVMWDKDSCQDAGFLKIDLLGLGMLSAVERSVDEIHRLRGETVDLSRIDLKDEPTFEMIRRADTTGVFQIESRAQMQMLPRMQPQDLDDLTVQVALIRPGPIQGGAVHPYLERRMRQREDPDFEIPYIHPLLEPVLKETLGVIIFQEQVIEVAMQVAGFSSSEAESLRRAMSRKRSRRALEAHHQRFIEGAGANGLTVEQAERVYTQIAGFSGFGFPKAHSAAFGLLAYQSAWLKLHYGPEYLASLLNEQPMGFYPPDSLVSDARRSGIEVLPPDINSSRVECSAEWPDSHHQSTEMRLIRHSAGFPSSRCESCERRQPAVRIGLGYIKGAREDELGELVAERDRGGRFRDLGDLASRLPMRREDLELLAWAGALRSLPRSGRAAGLWSVGLLPRPTGNDAGRQLALPLAEAAPPALDEPAGWDRVRAEYGSTGMTLEGHPMALIRPTLPERVLTTTAASALPDRSWTEVAGLMVARQRPETANGVIFILAEDEHGTINLVLPPQVAARHRLVVKTSTLIRARGRIESRHGTTSLAVRGLTEIIPPDRAIKTLAPTGFNFG